MPYMTSTSCQGTVDGNFGSFGMNYEKKKYQIKDETF